MRFAAHRRGGASTLIELPFDGLRAVRQGERGAFTLVELLVVVAIFMVLVAMLVPSLRRAKEMALRAYCAASERVSLVAAAAYASNNAGKFPPAPPHWYQRVKTNQPYEIWTLGTLLVQAYVPAKEEVFFCPSGKATWNWQSFSHLIYGVVDHPETTVECYITYSARFTEIGSTKQLTSATVGKHAPLIADYAYWDQDPAAAGWNFALYWGNGSIQPHRAEGLNVGYYDGSAAWLPFAPVDWVPGATTWLGMYNDHYCGGNIWWWARQQYGRLP